MNFLRCATLAIYVLVLLFCLRAEKMLGQEASQKPKQENKPLKETIDSLAKDNTTLVYIKKSYKGENSAKLLDVNGNESYRVFLGDSISFAAYVIKDPAQIKFFWKYKRSRIGTLTNLKKIAEATKEKLIFAMNAGIFQQGGKPEGLFTTNGKEQIKLNTKKGEGNFFLNPNGVFFIDQTNNAFIYSTETFVKRQPHLKIKNATQSGPMLVIDNELHEVFVKNSKHFNIRNGVGVQPNGSIVFLISEQRVTLYTFASVFKEHFGCPNALYLDGAISQAYLPKLNKKLPKARMFGPMIGVYKNKK